MANEEHLKILRQSVEMWNRWRKDNREIRPDLGGADLSEVDLRYADLNWADLFEANLSRANLSKADFSEADFTWADLSNVDFHHASLLLAKLINANLDGANLTGTCLWKTQRAGWSIKGVICEYVYWDRESKEKTEYAPGEFEKLFCQPSKG
jgi:uncharacterized protein YjbI with pentapeptide repeats